MLGPSRGDTANGKDTNPAKITIRLEILFILVTPLL
jgi:hypothetical protein